MGGELPTPEAPENPLCPRGSILARVITDSRDSFITNEEDLTIFWPMFPYDMMPIKEGEHVYIIFEDEKREHGLWLTRCPEPANVDNSNLTLGRTKYEEDPGNDFTDIGAEQAVQDMEEDPGAVEQSQEFVVQEVPGFKPRVGDRVIHGSNNTAIIFGRDRPSNSESGEQNNAGTIDIVAGRTIPDDLNMADDLSRLYVSMNTDIDGNLNISVGSPAGPKPSAGLKSDEIRLVARTGMKLVVEGGDVFIEGANIHLGPDAKGESGVLGETLVKLLQDILKAIQQLTVNTAVGPSTPPLNLAAFKAIEQKLNTALSKTVKLKK